MLFLDGGLTSLAGLTGLTGLVFLLYLRGIVFVEALIHFGRDTVKANHSLGSGFFNGSRVGIGNDIRLVDLLGLAT